jgi:hypothetical protein
MFASNSLDFVWDRLKPSASPLLCGAHVFPVQHGLCLQAVELVEQESLVKHGI